jgi:hypothetical protein
MSSADLSGLSQRVRGLRPLLKIILPGDIVPGVALGPSPQPTLSGCLHELPVGRYISLLSPTDLCFVLRRQLAEIHVAPWLRAVCIFCVFYAVEYVVTA